MDNPGQSVLVTDTNDDIAPLQEKSDTDTSSDQPLAVPQSPVTADYDLWHTYWRARSQPWRTEEEIETRRQLELDQYMAILPDVEQMRYSFSGIGLRRADIEWLLATQQGHWDTVNRSDELQSTCEGLDLRGADLRKARLRGLPLSGMYGGLSEDEWLLATDMQCEMAAVHLERADLRGAHLEGAILCGAHLEEADLRGAHLEGADLRGAHLAGANLSEAHLESAILCQAHLEGKRNFSQPANLRRAFFDSATRLEGVILGNEQYGFVPLADIHWGNVNLAEVDWTQVDRLGDEYEIHWKLPIEYQYAIRANRQLAAVLQLQGLRDDADHFAYRACVKQCFLRPQQALLPIVLRVFVRERMPLPKVLLRLEECRQGQRMPRHPLRMTLVRLMLSLLVVIVIALLKPLVLGALLALCVLLFLAVLPTMRKRRLRPLQYRRSQKPLTPPGLLSQRQRRRQQWLLLLGFLLGMPKAQLPLLLGPASAALPQLPLLGRLWARQRNHPLLVIIAPPLILLLLFDDTLVCYGRFIFSLFLGVLTGYGYKPWRSLCWYLIVVSGFAALYSLSGSSQLQAAFLLSLTSFHGYGFFVGNPAIAPVAIAEAVIGLIIEACFVATLTRRFLGK